MTHEQQPTDPQGEVFKELAATPEQAAPDPPEIWVGSLADYNNGDLHGTWLDAAREPEEIYTDIRAMLGNGPAAARGEAPEEWGIFDYQSFGSLRIGEYEPIEQVARLAHGIAQHGPAFAVWAEVNDSDEAALEQFEEAYAGRYESATAYADELVGELGLEELLDQTVPEALRPYVQIDTEQLAHDMQLGGDILVGDTDPENGVFVFHNIY